MNYIGTPDFRHGTPERLGVLLLNLGTPEAPDTASVRRYLAQFLADPRIIEMPRWLWRIILHGIILRVRPSRSAEAYQSVWTEEGSPLLTISRRQAEALQVQLRKDIGHEVRVALGMRYQSPSVDEAMRELEAHNVRRLIVLPMYPQYSGTTTASAFDELSRRLQRTRWLPELRMINQYFDSPEYIQALAGSVREHWKTSPPAELLVTSYHGIPRRYLDAGDPYHCHCYKTTRLLAEALELPPEKVRVCFQSRVGREEWLKPYLDETLKALPGEGVKSVDVISPAFSVDCLETIEEIDEENREYFLHAGGERFSYIPCLNDGPSHIGFLSSLVQRHIQGWPEADPHFDLEAEQHRLDASHKRAEQLKQVKA